LLFPRRHFWCDDNAEVASPMQYTYATNKDWLNSPLKVNVCRQLSLDEQYCTLAIGL
jgi:hypothetical protein